MNTSHSPPNITEPRNMKNKHIYSPPPQRPRRLPPLRKIVDDPFRYRRTLDVDLSSDIGFEAGVSNSKSPLPETNDRHLTNLPNWEEYDEEVKLEKKCSKNKNRNIIIYLIDDTFVIV